MFNIENACASGSTALQLAVTALRAGDADIALAVGAEKTVSPNRELMFSVFNGAWDVAQHEAIVNRLLQLGGEASSRLAEPRQASPTASLWYTPRSHAYTGSASERRPG